MALRQLGAVRAEDHRHVRIGRKLRAEGRQHVHLPRRVVQVVVAADHVRHAHVHVVDHDAEVVGRRAVAARDHQVVEFLVAEHHPAMHQVLDHDLAVERVLEADDRVDARPRVGAVAPAPVVARLLLARHLLRAQLVELFLGAVAAVRLALRQQLPDHLAISREALRLVVRALVRREAQPLHALEDHPHRLLGRALAVGVLDPQDEAPAVAPRMQPAEQRRAHAADMEHPGRARGETGDDRHGDPSGSIEGRES
jgi:hypothetical protein